MSTERKDVKCQFSNTSFRPHIILIAYQLLPACRITFTSVLHQILPEQASITLVFLTFPRKPGLCCVCAKLACIRPLTQLTPRSQILKCWQTSSTGRLEGKTERGKKKIFLLQALFVGSWYCHNNIWRPSCRFTELGCAFGWSIFPQMTLAGLLCEELTNLWSWKSGCWAVVCCNVSVKNQSERFEQVLRAGMRRSGLGCRKMEHNFKFTEDLHGIFLCGYPINPSRVKVNLLVQCVSSRKHESIKNSVTEDAIYDFLLRAQRSCHDFWVQIPSNRKQWLTL